jgi:alcohol dehydrogenase (NADP+)
MELDHVILRGGARMPAIGLGTFGSDRYRAPEVAEAVREGLALGYRMVDCASVYGNEPSIGAVLHDSLRQGIPREELFIVSKLWNDMHGRGDVLLSCAQSLKDLRLDYLDMYFVHWPFPNVHPRGAAPDYRSPEARPYLHEEYMETWRQMERLQRAGYVRHIGTSNMTVPKLDLLLRDCGIPPAANEMELHPTFQQTDLLRFCLTRGIRPIGYSPLGSPSRPARDKTPEDAVDMEDPAVVRIAEARGIHPSSVCLQWAVRLGAVPIPFSVKPAQIAANLRAVMAPPLTDTEMACLASAERNSRLIKGQVFLWERAKDWTDLWDTDGRIPGSSNLSKSEDQKHDR